MGVLTENYKQKTKKDILQEVKEVQLRHQLPKHDLSNNKII